MVAIYPAETVFPVYHPSSWYSDKWDPLAYGQEVSFDRPFLEQWKELMNKVPRLGVDIVNCENSDYCNYCGDNKNCYLDIAGEANEDCYFNLFTKYSKNCVDNTFVYNSELMYESINCYQCYNTNYSIYLENCTDCSFCFDLKGCSDCLFSYNLRNKKYCIFNIQYSPEEYKKKVQEMNMGSLRANKEHIKEWKTMMKKAVHRDMYNLSSKNCIGNEVKNSKNCQYAYNVSNCEDSKYLYDVLDAKDCYDLNYSLYKPELAYETISTLSMNRSAFNMASHYCHEIFYGDLCNNSSYLFGCIGLNQKKYCILNKQYTKEEYETLVPKIIEHMTRNGEWGEFFSSSISPFGYNETVAQEYFPLTENEVEARKLQWHKEEGKGLYEGPKYEVPDSITNIPAEIIKTILSCSDCKKNYRIIAQELQYYRNKNLPIPDTCPTCRHKNRTALRNPRKLWSRNCEKCSTSIQTSYSPDRPETIYCEKCYLEAVY